MSTSPSTYNPRDNSFIKAPEIKTCVACGQPIAPEAKPMANHMNNYMHPDTKNVVAMNSNENIVEVQGVKLYKVTGKDSTGKPSSTFIPVAPVNKTVVPPTK